MIFTEARFVLLLAASLASFFLAPVSWRRPILIASGLAFYLMYAAAALWIVLGLILVTWASAGRWGVWLNALALIGITALFKTREWIIPLGLSFLAFELIHLAVERHRGKVQQPSLRQLAAFALFFPCRIAGPIKRYQLFDRSIDEARWTIGQCYTGSARILWGLLKKVAVADVLALMTPELREAATPFHAAKSLLAYSLYIYMDFSAYSDIAIGLSTLFGLRVPENFRWPYLSANIREFWSRWHISLSSWLGDYLYLPLSKGLAKKRWGLTPRAAAVVGYVLTFAICGVWHGLSWNYFLWGLYHGVLLSAYSLYAASGRQWRLGRVAATAVTFAAVTLGWALFALDVPTAMKVYGSLIGIKA